MYPSHAHQFLHSKGVFQIDKLSQTIILLEAELNKYFIPDLVQIIAV